ncbi:MAG TPA: di-heme oxidoredictase family protein [Dongiaceae bacterium]
MKRAVLAAMLWAAAGAPALAGDLDTVAGKALFERAWIAAPASTDAADGLGPLFNGKACNSCHKEARAARFFELDGRLVTRGLVVRLATPHGAPHPLLGQQLQDRAVPGLMPEGEVLASLDGDRLMVQIKTLLDPLKDPFVYEPRVAPSLRGRGLLERIDERAVLALADPGDRDGDGISGRARLIEGEDGVARLGRFGAKATAATLEAQTGDAASIDLGLSSPYNRSPYGDCTPAETDCLRMVTGQSDNLDGEEMSAEIVRLIAAYVRSLPPPKYPSDANAERLLAASGCTACHHPNMPDSQGNLLPVHTDLLLHDLGAETAGKIGDDAATAAEWRTAPLIDLDPMQGKRRYLHGGEAATLDQAIRLHGGEAAKARDLYLGLTAAERATLLAWLAKL